MAECCENVPSVSSSTDVENETLPTETVPKSSKGLHSQKSPPPFSANTTATSSLCGSSSYISPEERMRRLREKEQLNTEQRRQQLLESTRLAEEKRDKQKEERKRRIEESKLRDLERNRTVLERKRELDKQYHDRVQNLLSNSRNRSDSASDFCPNMTSSSMMSNNNNNLSSLKGKDRMTASFTVAFGSSAPRSICTQASEAALRSQAAFEARLASYLNGRHSGCFLTQTSPYTNYARYVKPNLLPENHPIFSHTHELSSYSRRAVSANPSSPRQQHTVRKQDGSMSNLNSKNSARTIRAVSSTRQSRPNEKGVAHMQRTSSQHFLTPTVASQAKFNGSSVEGEPVQELKKRPMFTNPQLKPALGGGVPERRPKAGRSGIPRDRCHSYVDSRNESAARQRAPSADRHGNVRVTDPPPIRRKPSITHGDAGRGRSKARSKTVMITELPKENPPVKHPLVMKKTKPNPEVKLKLAEVKHQPIKAKPSQHVEVAQPQSVDDFANEVSLKEEVQPAAPISSGVELTLADELSFAKSPIHSANEVENNVASATDSETEEGGSVWSSHKPIPADVSEAVAVPLPDSQLSSPVHSLVESQQPEISSTVPDEPYSSTSVVNIEIENEIEVQAVKKEETTTSVKEDEQKIVKQETITKATTSPRVASPVFQGPISSSTTGAGEGGKLADEDAAVYRAKMAEQRRLAKERMAEEQKRQAEEEARLREEAEAARLVALEAAREKAVEQAKRDAEARIAAENAAAEAKSRLEAEAEAERFRLTTKERERLEAKERDRLEVLKQAEEERATRKQRLATIMSRVKVSGSALSRTGTSDSTGSLSSMTRSMTNAVEVDIPTSSTAPVLFNLGGSAAGRTSDLADVHANATGLLRKYSNGFKDIESAQNGFYSSATASNRNAIAHNGDAPSSSNFQNPLLQSLMAGRNSSDTTPLDETQMPSPPSSINNHDFMSSSSMGTVAGGTNG